MNLNVPRLGPALGSSRRASSRGAVSRRTSALMIPVLLIGLALLGPGVAQAASPTASVPSGSWPYPNGDLANTRDATGAVISSANVSDLQEAWSFDL
ncbi:MAG: hypothetical protein WCB86_03455, partial [Candidatus Dormiibacterota bacterium]